MSTIVPRPGSVKGSPVPSQATAPEARKLGFTFKPVPDSLDGKGLKASQKLLCAALIRVAKLRGGGAVSMCNLTLAGILECSDSEVKRDLRILEDKGLIRREHEDDNPRKPRRIYVEWAAIEPQEEPEVIPLGGRSDLTYCADGQYQGGSELTQGVGQVRPTGGSGLTQGVGQNCPPFKNGSSEEGKKNLAENAPSSPSSPASAGPNPKTPPAGRIAAGGREGDDEGGGGGEIRDAHEARVAELAVQNARRDGRDVVGEADVARAREILDAPAIRPHLEGMDAADALRAMAAEARREQRRPAQVITPEQNAAGIEWLGRWRKWRDGGKAGPIPEWTSSEPMIPGVRLKFDEHARAGGAAG